jgi:hypothetical protein
MRLATSRRLANALLFAVSAAVGLAVAELSARLTAPFFLFDGEIVFKVRPYTGHEGIPTETRDGIVMWRFPRDDRPSPRPVKDGFRIVVLGDSVLFPAGVADADGAARRLERLLNEHLDGGPYEVVDLAEPGFNTQQEERTLLDSGLPLQPDLVLVGVTPNDDQEFALENGQLMEVRFLRHMRARGANGAFQALAQRSYLYNWLWLARETTVDVPVEDVDPLIEAPLRRMHAAARQHDADLAVMCFPDYYGPRAERLDPRRDRCRFQRIAEWAAAARVPYLDLVDAEAPYWSPELRIDEIHRSVFGHEVDAIAIFDWLVADHVVPYRAIRGRPTTPAPDYPASQGSKKPNGSSSDRT